MLCGSTCLHQRYRIQFDYSNLLISDIVVTVTILLRLSLITILPFTDNVSAIFPSFLSCLARYASKARVAVRSSFTKIRLEMSDFLRFPRCHRMVSRRRSHWNLTSTGLAWHTPDSMAAYNFTRLKRGS